MCRVSQIIYLHFLRHPPPLYACNSRKARALDSRLEWSSPIILNLLHVFSFETAVFNQSEAQKIQNQLFQNMKSTACKEIGCTSHSLAWYLQLWSTWAKNPKSGTPKVQLLKSIC